MLKTTVVLFDLPCFLRERSTCLSRLIRVVTNENQFFEIRNFEIPDSAKGFLGLLQTKTNISKFEI